MSGTAAPPGQTMPPPAAATAPAQAPPAIAPPTAAAVPQTMPQNLAMFGQAASQPATPGANYLATILQALHGAHQQQLAAQQTIPNPQTYQPPPVSIQTPAVTSLPTPGPLQPPTNAELWQGIMQQLIR